MHFYTQNSMRTALTSHPGRRTNSSVPTLSSCWVGQWKEDLPFLTYHTGTDPRSFINTYLLLLQLLHEPEGGAILQMGSSGKRLTAILSKRAPGASRYCQTPTGAKIQHTQITSDCNITGSFFKIHIFFSSVKSKLLLESWFRLKIRLDYKAVWKFPA